jgi:hypothetical protein
VKGQNCSVGCVVKTPMDASYSPTPNAWDMPDSVPPDLVVVQTLRRFQTFGSKVGSKPCSRS